MPETTDGRHPTLEHLEGLVGAWEIEATHLLLPNTTIRGRATFEWFEGRTFLIWRVHYDHPDIPDGISIIGFDNAVEPDAVGRGDAPCAVHYFDERGVHRASQTEAGPGVWRVWRDWPGFSQRFTATFSDDGDTISCPGELSEDDETWKPDMSVTYRRVR